MSNRRNDSAVGIPSKLSDPCVDRWGVDPCFLAPLRDCGGFVVDGQQSARTPVVGLFDTCGPAAILWRVVTVVVLAFNRVLRAGTWSHISQEGRETLSPLWAHGDASAAIASVSVVGLEITPAIHGGPDSELVSVRAAMGWLTGSDTGRTKAPTTLYATVQHAITIGAEFGSALTSATNSDCSGWAANWVFMQHNEHRAILSLSGAGD